MKNIGVYAHKNEYTYAYKNGMLIDNRYTINTKTNINICDSVKYR